MRKSTLLLFLALVVLFLASCVPNRKVLFFQSKDELKKKHEKDSILRRHDLAEFNYKVQPQDLLSVRYQTLTEREFDFMNLPVPGGGQAGAGQLTNGELVDENGEIQMQGLGKVKVAGLTVFEIQDKLQALAKQYLKSPIVRVRLLNYRATLLGEVNKEGHLTFQNANRVSMAEAIGLAGGFTDMADRSQVKVIRQQNSKLEVFYVNLLKEEFLDSPFYFVYQNDVIVVPPLKQRPLHKYWLQDLAIVLSTVSFIIIVASYIKK